MSSVEELWEADSILKEYIDDDDVSNRGQLDGDVIVVPSTFVRVGDINKLLKTVASNPYDDLMKEYVKFLRDKQIRISLAKMGENLRSWENTIRLDKIDKNRTELLMELWIELTNRQRSAWEESKDSEHKRNMLNHLMEMVDFADKIASYNSELKIKSKQLRRDILRPNSVKVSNAFDKIDINMNDDYVRNMQGFLKLKPNESIYDLLEYREAYLSRLRNIQANMEKALDYDNVPKSTGDTTDPIEFIGRMDVKKVKLHSAQPLHLFTTNTYSKLKDDVVEFAKETKEMKDGRVYLLRLRFEQAALMEICARLIEMTEDVTKLGETLKKANASNTFYAKCLNLLEDLEWGCKRTWQQNFEHDSKSDLMFWEATSKVTAEDLSTDSGWTNFKNAVSSFFGAIIPGVTNISKATTDKDTYRVFSKLSKLDKYLSEKVPKPSSVVYQSLIKGGNDPILPPPKPELTTFFDAKTSMDTDESKSKVQVSIDHWKSAAGRLFSKLRTAIAEVSIDTVQSKSAIVDFFVMDTVRPRLMFFSSAVNAAMKIYLRPSRIDPVENMAVKRLEKRKNDIARSGYRVSLMDSIRFRATDQAVRFLTGLKVLRFVGQICASWAARRSYSEQFNKTVHVDGKAPPPLTKMLYAFLGIDATLQLFVLMGLVMSSYVMMDQRKFESKLYVIDDEFIQAFLVDYFVTTITIGVLAYIIASLMRKKTYFHLAEDGGRVANAYGWSLIGISGVVAVIPPLFV